MVDQGERIQRLTAVLRQLAEGGIPGDFTPTNDGPLGDLEQEASRLIGVMRSSQQERLLFSVGPVVMFRWQNKEGWPVEYVSPNVVALTGYPLEELASGRRAYASVIHPEDLPQVFEEVTSNSKSGVAWFAHKPYRIVRASGESVWVADYTVVLRDVAGQITHYFGYIMDISEQVEQMSKLQAQQQVLDQLSNPILQVARGVLAVPLMGSFTGDRHVRMADELLNTISRTGSHTAVLDLTGLREIEEATIEHLLRISRAVVLLGCRCILSGFSPAMAAMMVQRGLDTHSLTTVATLQSAIELAQRAAPTGLPGAGPGKL